MSELILRTARLVMMPLSTDDLDEAATLYANPDVMAHVDGGPRNRDQSRRALEANQRCWKSLGWGRWAVREIRSGALLGECGIQHILDVPDLTINFGLTFSTRYASSDFATEAGHAITEDMWARITDNSVHSIIHPGDADRAAVLRTVGFRRIDVRDIHGDDREVWELPRLR